MKLGIVGSEAAKFTKLGEERARDTISKLLRGSGVTHVVSGHCHLGGIDIYAEEIGEDLGLEPLIFPPANLSWSGGYKPRNLQIAHNSDKVYCITVDKLPTDYKGMIFKGCYHCAKNWEEAPPHIKSGGCWTMYQAKKMGKEWELIVINND